MTSEVLTIHTTPHCHQVDQVFQEAVVPSPPLEPTNPLSPREREILCEVARGKHNKEISRKLKISPQTVKNHLTVIHKKLNCRNRTEAVAYALRQQWIWLPGFPHPEQPITAVA